MDRVDVLGLPVDVLTEGTLLDEVESRVKQGGQHTVAPTHPSKRAHFKF